MVQYWTTETGKMLLDYESDAKTFYQNTKYSPAFFTAAEESSYISWFSSNYEGKCAVL